MKYKAIVMTVDLYPGDVVHLDTGGSLCDGPPRTVRCLSFPGASNSRGAALPLGTCIVHFTDGWMQATAEDLWELY